MGHFILEPMTVQGYSYRYMHILSFKKTIKGANQPENETLDIERKSQVLFSKYSFSHHWNDKIGLNIYTGEQEKTK